MKKYLLLFLLSVLFVAGCLKQVKENKLKNIVEVILNDETNFFFVDTSKYPKNNPKLPIGVFDSGTGGLTVLDAIVNFDKFNNDNHETAAKGDRKNDFMNEEFIYFGDNANMPYGEYESNSNTELLKEHIYKDVQFLLGNKYYQKGNSPEYQTDKQPVKAIVIACNTATAYGKEDIEKMIKRMKLDIKVIGVIEAGVKGALENFSKNENGSIGVFATYGTVCSNGYPDEIKRQISEQNFKGNIQVFQQGGIGLAGAIDGASNFIDPKAKSPRKEYKGPSANRVEARIDTAILQRYCFDFSGNNMLFSGSENNPKDLQLNSIENNINYEVISLLEKIRKEKNPQPLKAVILGCTHYPFFLDKFKEKFRQAYNYKETGKYVYRHLMNKEIIFIDPSENTARELYSYLKEKNLFNNSDIKKSEFYISVPNSLNKTVRLDNQGKFTYEYKYGRKAGDIQEYIKVVPFSKHNIEIDVAERLKSKIPETYKLISAFSHANNKTKFLHADEKLD